MTMFGSVDFAAHVLMHFVEVHLAVCCYSLVNTTSAVVCTYTSAEAVSTTGVVCVSLYTVYSQNR